MFFDDHKRAVTLIRGKKDARGVRTAEQAPMLPEIVKDKDGELDGKHIAMQDFLSAHHEGSAQKMSEAMSNFMDLHLNAHEASEEPEVEST